LFLLSSLISDVTVRFVDSFLYQHFTQIYLISEDQLIAVNINDECKDTKFTNHLIQLIILSHRCTVKTLREKVFIN